MWFDGFIWVEVNIIFGEYMPKAEIILIENGVQKTIIKNYVAECGCGCLGIYDGPNDNANRIDTINMHSKDFVSYMWI